ncbi:MAG: bifunctional nuclease family protein [Planctomycetota bacterium]
MRNHTFFAKIHLSTNGRTVEIDSRPSDAIALGAASNAPIYVADHVFNKTS